jgi:hypothetical protein
LIYSRSSAPVFSGVPWAEIVASSAAAALLILAIGLSSGMASAANATPPVPAVFTSFDSFRKLPAPLPPCGTCQWDVNVANS